MSKLILIFLTNLCLRSFRCWFLWKLRVIIHIFLWTFVQIFTSISSILSRRLVTISSITSTIIVNLTILISLDLWYSIIKYCFGGSEKMVSKILHSSEAKFILKVSILVLTFITILKLFISHQTLMLYKTSVHFNDGKGHINKSSLLALMVSHKNISLRS